MRRVRGSSLGRDYARRVNPESLGQANDSNMQKLLFVCLGNICRSPMAEGAMRRVAERHGLDLTIDSAGTGDWHVGNAPDPRAIAIALADGVSIDGQRARHLCRADFLRYDLICVMDAQNLTDVRALAPAGASAEIRLFRDFVPGNDGAELADPYFGDDDGFAVTWSQAVEAAEALANWLEAQR